MWNTNIYYALITNPKIKGQLMAKYVPFLAPIRLLVGLHRGIQFNIPHNKDTYFILFNIIPDLSTVVGAITIMTGCTVILLEKKLSDWLPPKIQQLF